MIRQVIRIWITCVGGDGVVQIITVPGMNLTGAATVQATFPLVNIRMAVAERKAAGGVVIGGRGVGDQVVMLRRKKTGVIHAVRMLIYERPSVRWSRGAQSCHFYALNVKTKIRRAVGDVAIAEVDVAGDAATATRPA